jgi:hypothetical protein
VSAGKARGFKKEIARRERAGAAATDDRDRNMLCFAH